jgi:hypothetical protein
MPAARDPLSVRYDAAVGALLDDAMARQGRWVYRAVPRPAARSARSRAWLAAHGIQLDELDSGGLTAYQRAYQRALYHVAKERDISTPAGDWSLQRDWGPETRYGRVLGVRVSGKAAARRAVRRKAAAERYTENPAIRSSGQGTGRERFA